MACNINNEMVLLWKDVTITNEKEVAASNKSLQEATIEEVLEGFVAVARRHEEKRKMADTGIEMKTKQSSGISKYPTITDTIPNQIYTPIQGLYDSEMHDIKGVEMTPVYGVAEDTHYSNPVSIHDEDFIDVDNFEFLQQSANESCDNVYEKIWVTSNRTDRSQTSDVCPNNSHLSANDSKTDTSRFDSGHFGSSGDFSSFERSKNSVDTNNNLSSSCVGDEGLFDSTYDYPEVFYEDQVPERPEDIEIELSPKTSPSSHGIATIDVLRTLVQCQNDLCGKTVSLDVARNSYKNCHNCHAAYCSRTCRQTDWEKHKQTVCHGSRVNSACKHVIKLCNHDPEIGDALSRIARRGYISNGRGCVMLGFPDLSSAKEFLEWGLCVLELNPIYVTLKELRGSKMFGSILEKLLDICRTYNPEFKYVLNVGVGVKWNRTYSGPGYSQLYGTLDSGFGSLSRKERTRSGSFGSDGGYGSLNCSLNGNFLSSFNQMNGFSFFEYNAGSLRHKGPIIQKCIRLKLNPAHHHAHRSYVSVEDEQRQAMSRYGPTLFLTGIPGGWEGVEGKKKRELCFINIQRKLRQRGVILRHQLPLIYSSLIQYVNDGTHFPSEIIQAVDTKAKKLFTCIFMPEAEPDLEWTRSEHLLDDLDISKECIWSSLSRSKSFPSSLHLRHHNEKFHPPDATDLSVGEPSLNTSCTTNQPTCRKNVGMFHKHPKELSTDAADSSPKHKSLQKYPSAPNISTSPPQEHPSEIYVFTDPNSSARDDFSCLPNAASSPKSPKSNQHQRSHSKHQLNKNASNLESPSSSHSEPCVVRKSCLKAKTRNSNTGPRIKASENRITNSDNHRDMSSQDLDLSFENRRNFNTNSPFFPTDFNIKHQQPAVSHRAQSSNHSGKILSSNFHIDASTVVMDESTNDLPSHKYAANDCPLSSMPATPPWPPSHEYVNTIVNQWNSSPPRKYRHSSSTTQHPHCNRNNNDSSKPPPLHQFWTFRLPASSPSKSSALSSRHFNFHVNSSTIPLSSDW